MNLKNLWISLLVGWVLLYFVAAAAKASMFSSEMMVRNFFHFATGFALLGIWVLLRKRNLGVKASLFLILAIALVYDVVDYLHYLRHAHYVEVEKILHDLYVLLWGAVTGYLTLEDKGAKPLADS